MPKKATKKKKVLELPQEHDKSNSPKNAFYFSFIGELVEIICAGATTTTEIGMFPIVANGYLLDLDDEYLYLSDDALTIARAIKKTNIVTVEIVKQMTPSEEALVNMEVPGKKEDGN